MRPLSTKNYFNRLFRKITSPLRILPDFIIFGVGRCGTTSLYNYLTEHPNVGSAQVKEIFFFDYHFHKGVGWYQKHFPLPRYYKRFMTGDATPSYIHHPLAPHRIKELLPQVKLIVLLRNPIDRAYSHYCQTMNGKLNPQFPFEIVVRYQITERNFFAREKILGDEQYFRQVYYPTAYLSKSVYLENLKRWFQVFPKEQILVLKNEEMSADPQKIFQKTIEFLELPRWELKEYKKYNYQGSHFGQAFSSVKPKLPYGKMAPLVREQLIEYFRPYNQQLYEFLGIDFGWEQ